MLWCQFIELQPAIALAIAQRAVRNKRPGRPLFWLLSHARRLYFAGGSFSWVCCLARHGGAALTLTGLGHGNVVVSMRAQAAVIRRRQSVFVTVGKQPVRAVPRHLGMVLADPPYAETFWALLSNQRTWRDAGDLSALRNSCSACSQNSSSRSSGSPASFQRS